jgi:hypothetical protein
MILDKEDRMKESKHSLVQNHMLSLMGLVSWTTRGFGEGSA